MLPRTLAPAPVCVPALVPLLPLYCCGIRCMVGIRAPLAPAPVRVPTLAPLLAPRAAKVPLVLTLALTPAPALVPALVPMLDGRAGGMTRALVSALALAPALARAAAPACVPTPLPFLAARAAATLLALAPACVPPALAPLLAAIAMAVPRTLTPASARVPADGSVPAPHRCAAAWIARNLSAVPADGSVSAPHRCAAAWIARNLSAARVCAPSPSSRCCVWQRQHISSIHRLSFCGTKGTKASSSLRRRVAC